MKTFKAVNGDELFLNYKPLGLASEEIMMLVFIDQDYNVTHKEEIARGALKQVGVNKEKIMRMILDRSPKEAVILMHNHPHAKSYPSDADDETTTIVEEMCKFTGRTFGDHIIIGKNEFYSYTTKIRTVYVTGD